jgi:hypothetical protein
MNWQKPPLGIQLNVAHPLARGLVGCWVLNEAKGSIIYDLSRNDHCGTITAGATWKGSVLSFNGASKVNIANPEQLQILGDLTLISKVRVYSFPVSNAAILIYRGDNVGEGDEADNILYAMHVETTGQLRAFWEYNVGSNVIVTSAGAAATVGEWATLVIVRSADGTAVTFFVDGVQFESTTTGKTRATGGGNGIVTMGYEPNGATGWAFLNGAIEYSFIYNRALSASEIAWHYCEPYSMFRQDELALWAAATSVGAAGWTGKICGVVNPSKICGVLTSGV